MTNPATYRRVLELSMPESRTPARMEWLKAAMETIADAIMEHADSEVDALVGLNLLVEYHAIKRISGK